MDTTRAEAFRVLGIPTDSNPDAVAHAYRRLARSTHPDVSSAPGAADRFARIATAYRLLSAQARTTSISVHVAAPVDDGWAGRAEAVEDPMVWDRPIPPTWTAPMTPMTWRCGRRRRESAPIVAGPAWVTPLRRRNDTDDNTDGDTEVQRG